jgi:transposase-like protein
MGGRSRRSFTEDYKRQCAELVVSSGRLITSVAKELGLRDSVLRRWVEQFAPQPTSAARRPPRKRRRCWRTRLRRSPGCARRTKGCA